jgi:hypothetical protein
MFNRTAEIGVAIAGINEHFFAPYLIEHLLNYTLKNDAFL